MDWVAMREKYNDGGDVCCNTDSPGDLDEISLLEIETVAISMERAKDGERVHT
jgi:hypothetical protein